MENLAWGLQITALGMGLVFGLLALLWGLLTLVLRLDREPAPEAQATASAASGMEPELAAAITVAVLTHKEQRRQEAAPSMRSYWPGSLLHSSRWVASGRARQNRSWRREGR